MAFDDITVALTYTAEAVGDWSLQALCHDNGVIDPDHLDPAGWRDAQGGLILAVNRVYRVLDTTGRTDLWSHAFFLGQCLASLTDAPALRAICGSHPGASLAELGFEDGTLLRIARDADLLRIDFLDANGAVPHTRLSPFFTGLLVQPAAFTSACALALHEWAQVTRRTMGAHPPAADQAWRLAQAIGA